MVNDIIESEELFEVTSVLQKKVRVTARYWEHIVKHKHPELEGMLKQSFDALKNADEVYRQEETGDIYLYYQQRNHFSLCIVVRHLNGNGFIVTAYLTTRAKRKGIIIWKKNTT